MIEFREATHEDIENITRIYNSNPEFLLHHLGVEQVDELFVRRELRQMKDIGFLSEVFLLKDDIIGFIDYRAGEEVYFSLLILFQNHQRQGVGKKVYRLFEERMARLGAKSIRIDIVDDYETAPISFWKQFGYKEQQKIRLTWGNKTSSAVVMIKTL